MTYAQAFHNYQEAWLRQDWDRWQQTLAVDYRFSTTRERNQTRDETLNWSQAVFNAFPDYDQSVVDLTTADNVVVAEFACSGTFTGSLLTGSMPLEPTGRHFTARYCKIITFDRDAHAVRDHQYLDMLGLLRQLGYHIALA